MSKINKIKVNNVVYDVEDISKQEILVSGTNIKTINGTSVLGEGNIVIEGGSGGLSSVAHDGTMTGAGTNASPLGVDTTKIAQLTDIPDVSNFITKDVNDLTYYYTKTEVDGKVSAVYKFKGSVSTYANLPSSGLTAGDVYNVESDGSNYAWTGTAWDKLGGDIDLSGYQTKIDSTHKLSADLVDDTSTTNKFVTASDKTNWDAKGTYSKPSGGIPKTDLASEVQTSLGKADTALQSETYTGTITGITMNGASKGTSGVVDLGTVITSHQDISGKQDKIVAGTNITIANDGKTISATDTTYNDATTSASGLMSATDKIKLNGIATGAEVNVQSDWNESSSSSDAYIKNKPTIPTVNNSTITIQKNSTTVDSFTTNASSNKTINISVPTDTSDLTNGAGYTTNTGTITGITMNGSSKGTSGVVDLGTVITSHQDLSNYATKTYVDDHIENGVDVIPSYWQTTVDNAIGRVEMIQREKGMDCFNFVWYSDIHLKESVGDGNYGKNVFSLSKYIADKLNIPIIISTGDSVTNSVESTEQAMRDDFDYFNELSYKIKDKLINCYGNHDGAWGDNREGSSGYLAAYAWHLRPRDYWNDLMRRQTNQVERHYSLDGSYGYVDIKSQKTRIIQLNSFWVGDNDTYYSNGTMIYDYMHHGGYGQTQLSWLANEALSFDEDGWKVILMAHIPPTDIDSSSYLTDKAQTRDADILNGILTAYYNEQTYNGSYTYNSGRNEGSWANVSISVDYTSVSHKATIKGFFAGHCHRSRIVKNVLPFPILTITCAANASYDSQAEGSRTNNSTTETAFDIVSVCDDAIYCTRIGVGSDRATVDLQTYDIDNNLTHCTTDNNASTIIENSPYSATITADNGYAVSSITVYMGVNDITSTAVSGNNISIASVTDDITITATATVSSSYSITNTLTNCDTDNNTQSVVPNSSYTATLTASNGYTFTGGTITVSMGNNDITSTALNGTTITINSVTGNVVIVGTAVAEMTNKMVVDSEHLNKRVSSTFTETSGSGCFITNPIEVDITQSCPVQFRGFATNMGTQGSNKNYGNSKVTLFDTNNTALATWYISRQETSGNWITTTSGDNIVGDLSTILNVSPTAGTLPAASNVKYVVFSPQISASTISSSDLTGLGIYMY